MFWNAFVPFAGLSGSLVLAGSWVGGPIWMAISLSLASLGLVIVGACSWFSDAEPNAFAAGRHERTTLARPLARGR